MIRGITVIGDVLRPDGNGAPGGADAPVTWLFHAIKRQVGQACGLPIGLVSNTLLPEWRAWIEAERPPRQSALFWAARFQTLADRAAFDRMILPHLRDRFCVGFELPPYLSTILDQAGISYLDLRIHPVRFLDDLLFAARASTPGTTSALLNMAAPEAEVIATAGLREAMCHLIGHARLPDDTLLVLGQRPMDSTQIIGGGFFDAMEHAASIADHCGKHCAVLLKPHPQEAQHSLMTATAGIAANIAGVSGDNIYRLLASPRIAAVLTVNSSAAYEAPYFGKPVHRLAPLPVQLAWRGDAATGGHHVSVDDRVLTADFWRTVLAPHAPVTQTDGIRLQPKPNRLRIALDSFWNFQEIDTGRIPPGR